MTIRSLRFSSILLLVLFAFMLSLTPVFSKTVDPATEIEKEIELGKEAAKDVEKECKLVTDEAVVSRVRTVGEKLARVAMDEEMPASYGSSTVAKFDYTFKVVDDKKINAFCLPGGIIYVNTGLLDFVQSDHELAAVLAHEIAHASHHHVKSLVREQSRLHRKLALILLAGLVGKVPQRDMGNLMLGTQFYKLAKLNGYGQLAEKDADITAVRYLTKTEYNPVGMLTFLERLGKSSDLVDLGILQTHPKVDDRVCDVTEELLRNNVVIDRRKVTKVATASVRPLEDAKSGYEILIGQKTVVKLAGDKSRAEGLASSLNDLLDEQVIMKDICIREDRGTMAVNNQVIFEPTSQDAGLNGVDKVKTAQLLADGMRRAVWQEMVDQIR